MGLLLIPLLPFVAAAVLLLLGRRLGRFSPTVGLTALFCSLILSVQFFLSFHLSPSTFHLSFNWLPFGGGQLTLGLLADPLSITMALVVTAVGWLIMLYSIGYMRGDARFSRFFAYLSLFFGSMLTLVLADHFILLYIGWELVGLCSYLLIGFWFEKPSAANAGKKAFLTTRVGDLGLFAAILLIAKFAGSLSFANLSQSAEALGPMAGVVALLIFWGAAGKSAQFPLHVWLPDAMEGPTPVSALIHAATMVAAGVYLVARTLPIFVAAPQSLLVVAAVGGLTSFFAATIACAQNDLKRILAYSTISQLGFMMLGLGAGSAFAGMFHLVTHAWFKALLFLGAGSVIHALHHQDVTRMGGLWKRMPVTAMTFTLAAIAMAGIPPFSGFWSKEEIFVEIAVSPILGNGFLLLAWGISFLTAFYIFRAVMLAFFVSPVSQVTVTPPQRVGGQGRGESHLAVHESPPVMTIPLLLLGVGAVGIGFINSAWTGHGFNLFMRGVSVHDQMVARFGLAAVEIPQQVDSDKIQLVSVLIGALGMTLAWIRYGLGWQFLPAIVRRKLTPIYRVVANKYYVDDLYETALIRPFLALCRGAFSFDQRVVDGAVNGAGAAGLSLSRFKRWFDQTIVDGAVNGVAGLTDRAAGAVRLIQTGRVQSYLLIALAAAVGMFFLMWGGLWSPVL